MADNFNTNDPLGGGDFSFQAIQRLVDDPSYRAQFIDQLAGSYLLPKEVEDEDFPLASLFAAAEMPPEPPRPQASTGAGPSLGQTATPQPLQQQLYSQSQVQGPQIPSLGALIQGRK